MFKKSFVVLPSLVVVMACFFEGIGTLSRISTEGHGDVVFGVASPNTKGAVSEVANGIVLAIPTGQQRPNDVIRDIDSIWSGTAEKFGLTVICPASSSGLPFFSKDRGWFGHGAEVIIPYLLEDMRVRLGWNGRNLVLIDISGNGRGATSVVCKSPTSFDQIYIAPSFDVDRGSLSEYLSMNGAAPVTIVYGTETPQNLEDWMSAQVREEHHVRLLRAPLDPLHRQGQMDGVNLFAEYADFICEDLSNKGATH